MCPQFESGRSHQDYYRVHSNNLFIKDATCGFSSVVRALPCQGRGQELESPNPHQIRTKLHRRARKRLFCLGNYGFAQQNPSVFLGGELRFGVSKDTLFVFLPPCGNLRYNKRATNHERLFVFLRASMAVLDNLVFLGWLHQDGHLSWRWQ